MQILLWDSNRNSSKLPSPFLPSALGIQSLLSLSMSDWYSSIAVSVTQPSRKDFSSRNRLGLWGSQRQAASLVPASHSEGHQYQRDTFVPAPRLQGYNLDHVLLACVLVLEPHPSASRCHSNMLFQVRRLRDHHQLHVPSGTAQWSLANLSPLQFLNGTSMPIPRWPWCYPQHLLAQRVDVHDKCLAHTLHLSCSNVLDEAFQAHLHWNVPHWKIQRP